MGQRPEPHPLEGPVDKLALPAVEAKRRRDPKGHIPPDVEMGEGVVILEDQADGPPCRRYACHVGASQAHGAAGGRQKSRNQLQKRRLAAAARTDHGGESCRRHRKGERHFHPGDAIKYPVKLNHRIGPSARPRSEWRKQEAQAPAPFRRPLRYGSFPSADRSGPAG